MGDKGSEANSSQGAGLSGAERWRVPPPAETVKAQSKVKSSAEATEAVAPGLKPMGGGWVEKIRQRRGGWRWFVVDCPL